MSFFFCGWWSMWRRVWGVHLQRKTTDSLWMTSYSHTYIHIYTATNTSNKTVIHFKAMSCILHATCFGTKKVIISIYTQMRQRDFLAYLPLVSHFLSHKSFTVILNITPDYGPFGQKHVVCCKQYTLHNKLQLCLTVLSVSSSEKSIRLSPHLSSRSIL
jgi:hypothetical protein